MDTIREPKLLRNRSQTIEKMIKGMTKVNSLVEPTMGARGRHILIEGIDRETPIIINDGINIGRNVCLEDTIENMGARITIDGAEAQAKRVGDNTSLTINLITNLTKLGYAGLKGINANPSDVINGMRYAYNKANVYIDTIKKDVKTNEELYNVAFISSRDKHFSKMIVDAVEFVGKSGGINVARSYKREDYLEKTQGMIYPIGYRSAKLCKDKETMTTKFSDANVILVDGELKRAQQIYHILEEMFTYAKEKNDGNEQITKSNFLIVAHAITDEVVEVVFDNVKNSELGVYCDIQLMHTPTTNSEDNLDYLEDISYLSQSGLISMQDIATKKPLHNDFGGLSMVEMNERATILQGVNSKERNELIEERVRYLQSQLENEEITNSQNKKSKLKERISKLTSGIATIRLHANTKTEENDKAERFDDALRSVYSAQRDGIVAGGNVPLRDIANHLQTQDLQRLASNGAGFLAGYDAFVEAIKVPYHAIIRNADLEAPKEYKIGEGLNVTTGKLVDMIEDGILDTSLGIKSALEFAVVNASMVLRIDGSVVYAPKPPQN